MLAIAVIPDVTNKILRHTSILPSLTSRLMVAKYKITYKTILNCAYAEFSELLLAKAITIVKINIRPAHRYSLLTRLLRNGLSKIQSIKAGMNNVALEIVVWRLPSIINSIPAMCAINPTVKIVSENRKKKLS
ncbi:hypothetical protein D3C77_452500 [compost metagenome]